MTNYLAAYGRMAGMDPPARRAYAEGAVNREQALAWHAALVNYDRRTAEIRRLVGDPAAANIRRSDKTPVSVPPGHACDPRDFVPLFGPSGVQDADTTWWCDECGEPKTRVSPEAGRS